MTQDVDPAVIKQTGDAFRGVYDTAAQAVTTLAGVLKSSAGMAGTDNGAHAWASKYDALCGGREGASGVLESASAAVMATGQVADLLHATAVNHSNADVQAAYNSPDAPAVPPDSVPLFRVPNVPSAEGGHGDVPGWWHTISGFVQGELWPNGHQDKLKAAAQAWRHAAAGLRAAVFAANSATPYVEHQQSPEIPAVVANCNHARDALNSAAEGCDIAAKSCDDYASNIDDAHHAIIHEMVMLGATVAVTEFVAAVLIPFTVGASEAVSKTVDAERLVATGARIAEIIRGFRAAAEVSALPTVNAAAAAARSVGELGPLLSARAILFEAESGTAATTEKLADIAKNRPYLRKGTKEDIQNAAPKTPNGDYIDPNTGQIIPKDGPFHYGHKPGEEWWRIQEKARAEGWTREQLREYYNNPKIYQIEDPASNMSHKFELPREAP